MARPAPARDPRYRPFRVAVIGVYLVVVSVFCSQTIWQVVIGTNGTPSDPTEGIFVEDLGVVFGSTGTNDLQGRDFCEDYVLFTS